MVLFHDQLGHMKVKTGELKARLSHYLKLVNGQGETIEVCAREEPVAYLVPVRGGVPSPTEARETDRLRRQLLACDLLLAADVPGPGPLPVPTPSVAGDGRTDVSSVEGMRASRNW